VRSSWPKGDRLGPTKQIDPYVPSVKWFDVNLVLWLAPLADNFQQEGKLHILGMMPFFA